MQWQDTLAATSPTRLGEPSGQLLPGEERAAQEPA
jgi:hypothetical protein